MDPAVKIITLGARKYRKIVPDGMQSRQEQQTKQERKRPPCSKTEDENDDGDCRAVLQHEYDIRQAGKDFVLAYNVPERSFGLIIGRGGSRLREISQATGCRVVIPQNENQVFQIRGPSEGAVVQAMVSVLRCL